MSVNQKIKESLKHGDIKKISEILSISGSSVTERINSDREIDSVDFINAVCLVTGKTFTYFKPVVSNTKEEREDYTNQMDPLERPMFRRAPNDHLVNEDETIYHQANESAIAHYREKVQTLQQIISLNEKYIAELEAENRRLRGGE